MCAWWAPTPTKVVSVTPEMLFGGALLGPLPWQPPAQPGLGSGGGSTKGPSVVGGAPRFSILPRHPAALITSKSTHPMQVVRASARPRNDDDLPRACALLCSEFAQ